MTHTPFHAPNHTWQYEFKRATSMLAFIIPFFIVAIIVFCSMMLVFRWLDARKMQAPLTIDKPIVVEVNSIYKVYLEDGTSIKTIRNVGLTYYMRGEVYVPGIIMYSGRHVYEGAIAVSRDLLGKEVSIGDLVWIKNVNKWFKVEDSMGPSHLKRVDIYTHDIKLANSGSSRSDIIILRMPK